MAFSDPQSVKYDNTSATSLPRVKVGDMESEYMSEDGQKALTISTQEGKRKRHRIRVDLSKVIASVLTPSQNEEASCSVSLVVDRPKTGFTNEELRKLVEGFCTYLTTSEASAVKKLLGSES